VEEANLTRDDNFPASVQLAAIRIWISVRSKLDDVIRAEIDPASEPDCS
jgi:hypothetical protein